MNGSQGIGTAVAVPADGGRVRDPQRWARYAAVSLLIGLCRCRGASGRWAGAGSLMTPGLRPTFWGRYIGTPRAGRRPGSSLMLAGLPAAAMGAVMLRGVRGQGAPAAAVSPSEHCLPGSLLLLMTDINLLILLGYITLRLS